MTNPHPASLDDLVQEYRAKRRKATHLWLAEMEHKVVQFCPFAKGGSPALRWQQEVLGNVSQHELSRRALIFASGAAGSQLWERIEAGMRLGTAARLVQEAKRRSVKSDPVSLSREISDGLRRLAHLPARESESPAPAPTADESVVATVTATEPKKFWGTLRSLIATYASEFMVGIAEQERDALVSALVRDMTVTMDQHSARWSDVVRQVKDEKRVTRDAMRTALRVLKLDPPRRFQQVDLKAAKKAMKSLARLYHTDVNPDGLTQYREVLDAYAVVERWVEENPAGSAEPQDEEPKKGK